MKQTLAPVVTVVLTATGSAGTGASGAVASETTTAGATRDAHSATARGAGRGVRLRTVGRFRSPIFVTAPRGDRRRLFVVERGGRVRIIRDGRRLRRPFLDISHRVGIRSRNVTADHGGLFSIAFPPDYRRSRRLYVFYTNRDDSLRVEEFRRSRRSPELVAPRSGRVVLSVPSRASFDIGGQIRFGRDGFLYVGLGDSTGGHAAQDLGVLPGKLLRIDPAPVPGAPYTVPPSNPFVGVGGARPEIYAYGLRNPWRFSFDGPSGLLAIGDVGEDSAEEIDVVSGAGARAANFGWGRFEGNERVGDGEVPGYVGPAIVKSHGSGYCAIIGGQVVRDRSLRSLRGRYLYTDFCLGRLRSARLSSAGATGDRVERAYVSYPVAFGEDARLRVYVVSLEGRVYRFARR